MEVIECLFNWELPKILNDSLYAAITGGDARTKFLMELNEKKSQLENNKELTPQAFLEAESRGIKFPGMVWNDGMLILPAALIYVLPAEFPIEDTDGNTYRRKDLKLEVFNPKPYQYYGIVPMKDEENKAVKELEKFVSTDIVKQEWGGNLTISPVNDGSEKRFKIYAGNALYPLGEISTSGEFSVSEEYDLSMTLELQKALIKVCEKVRGIFKKP